MGLPALKADYLFAALALQARLALEMAPLPVEVCETAEQVLQADQRDMVLMVMWAGDVFGDSAGGGKSQQLRQRWMVIVALNNVSRDPEARQTLAGPVMSRVHAAVAGWTPQGAAHPFKRCAATTRPDITKTKALYPLCFDIELAL